MLPFYLRPLPDLSSSRVPAIAMDQVQELLPYIGTNDHHLFTGGKLPLYQTAALFTLAAEVSAMNEQY